jgi:hypothetical protein
MAIGRKARWRGQRPKDGFCSNIGIASHPAAAVDSAAQSGLDRTPRRADHFLERVRID